MSDNLYENYKNDPRSEPVGRIVRVLPTIDEFLDHLVIKEGNGPNGSDGEVRYWNKGVDLPAKAQLEKLMAAERLDELTHTESAGYTTINGDEMGYFSVADRIAQLTHQAWADGENEG